MSPRYRVTLTEQERKAQASTAKTDAKDRTGKDSAGQIQICLMNLSSMR